MKRIILLITLLQSLCVSAQKQPAEKPDYKKIEKEIRKQGSPNYYPLLLEKYYAGDISLTLDQKRHLYYGYTFQEAYSPYSHSDFSDSMRPILAKEVFEKQDYETLIRFGDSALVKNPFDLKVLTYKLYCFKKLNNDPAYKKELHKLTDIIDAIMSSGDGRSKESAFYVISVPNEYSVLAALGYDFGGEQSLIEHYDYLTLKKNDDHIEGLYFDISPSLNSMMKMLK